jgi:hypothetical protein
MGTGAIQRTNNDVAKKRRRVESEAVHVPYDSLDKYGYHFKSKSKRRFSTRLIRISLDGKFVSIETNEPFKFDIFPDKGENQKRYETIGRLIDDAVFEKLESECHLQRVIVPVCSFLTNEKRIFSLIFFKDRCKKE